MSDRAFNVLIWTIAYIAGAVLGFIVLIAIVGHAMNTGGDSGSPAGMPLALLLTGIVGVIAGMLLVGIVQFGIYLTGEIRWWRQRRNANRFNEP